MNDFEETYNELQGHWDHFNRIHDRFENTPFMDKAPKAIVLKELEKLKYIKSIIDILIKKLERLK